MARLPNTTPGNPVVSARELARLRMHAGVLKALAHPTRLLVVRKLAEREHCVCELTSMVSADVSTVSKHLSVLKHAGIVYDERRGNQVFYRLLCPSLVGLLDCIEQELAAAMNDRAALLSGH